MLKAISMLSFWTICRMVADPGNILCSEMKKSVLEMHAVLFLKCLILDNKYVQLRDAVSLFSVTA